MDQQKKKSMFRIVTLSAVFLLTIFAVLSLLSNEDEEGKYLYQKYRIKADSLFNLGKYIDAEKEYQTALRHSPKDRYVRKQLKECRNSKFNTFAKVYGGKQKDYANALVQTPEDGGFLVVGSTHSAGEGGADVWIIKTDKNGKQLWDQTYGNPGDDHAMDIVRGVDNGYFLVGYTNSFKEDENDDDAWLLKLNEKGEKVWEQTLGGKAKDRLVAITTTESGGYALTGFTQSEGRGKADVWVVKLDKDGSIIWSRPYGSKRWEIGAGIVETEEEELIVVGHSETKGEDSDAWVLKVDKEGEVLWEKHYGGPLPDAGTCITLTDKGHYIMGGYTESYGTSSVKNAWAVKIEPSKKATWRRVMVQSEDIAKDIIVNEDGTFTIIAQTYANENNSNDLWLLNLGVNGNVFWDKKFGRGGDDGGNAIIHTADGGYAIAGFTTRSNNVDLWLMKMNHKGEFVDR